MTWRKAAAVGFAGSLLFVAAIGWVLSHNTAAAIAAARAVARTHEALAELADLLSEIAMAEMVPHTSAAFGEERPLEPFSRAMQAIDQGLERLRQLTADNPNQLQRISLLKGLIDEKIAQLQHSIDVQWGEGFQPEAQIALTDLGKALMARIQWVVETMRGEEQALLLRQDELLHSRARLIYATIGLGIGLCVVLLAGMGYLVRREIAERTRVEKALLEAKEGSRALPGDPSRDNVFPQP